MKTFLWAGVNVSFKAGSFTRTFERHVRRYTTGERHHMRVGRFACIVAGRTLIAAQVYDESVCDDGSITRTSKYWKGSRADRLHQIARVESVLTRNHPYHDQLRADIAAERAHYGDA